MSDLRIAPEPSPTPWQCRWFGGIMHPQLNFRCRRPAHGRDHGLVLCDLHWEAAHMDPEDWTEEMRA